MSDVDNSKQLKDNSSNAREYQTNGDNNFPREYSYSNLQAGAPEYYPPNRSQGAVRKKPHRQNHEYRNTEGYQSRIERNINNSNLKPNAPEFYPSSNNGAVKKRFYDKNWKEKNKSTNWRSSVNPSEDVSYESRRYDRSRNFRHSSSSVSGNNKGYYNSNNYDRNNDEPYENTTGNDDSGSSIKYERHFNENTANGYRNKHFDRRNGYVNKSYGRGNRHKQNERHYSNYSEHNFVDRPIYTHNYNVSENKYKLYPNKPNKNLPTAGQRERLTEMLDSNLLECMVCCEKIKRTDKAWSCSQCYHILHLNCIVAWAKSSKVEDNWRCPACQNIYTEIPHQYICYCGKVTDPKVNPNIIAHGCDNMCLRKGKNCDHKCNILCHPGPCPECNIMVSKPCGCGLTQQVVKCCSDIKIVCDSICNKLLNCGLHKCTANCHVESCLPCTESIIQECYCGRTGRKVPCNKEHIGKTTFICENNCEKMLPCGIHKCQKQCHHEPCTPCETDVNLIKYCYCGKTPLETPRLSCLDPIPCCDKICGQSLICGPPSKPHICKEKCHKGKCPPCPLTTVIRCRCGHMDKEIACQKLTTKADDARCEKKCTKKRLCGKHTCKQKCCIEIEHVCPLPCNKLLTCGLHKCAFTCHSGRCPTCMETSFDELYCECGASVLYPPVPCGTRPPACKKQCSKKRDCGHPANHECHPGSCPACFVLTKQWCYGKHEQRGAIPCQQNSFSCGLPCGKPMPCGHHKCIKPCHEDKCPVPCNQPCTVQRLLCGHACNKPCHDPPCPESSCKQMVPVTCLCGLQKSSKVCMDLTEEFRNIETALIKDRMDNSSYNYDLTDVTFKKPAVLKILECNDECKIVERNRRLAIGLQIQNPDLSQKLTPRYSDFLKQWAKKDSKFCQRIHDKLTELVQLAKQSKQKSRSYSFESMNRDKRQFIHEYCEHFGVESAAYDAEPNRNVVATAIKDKSWLPSMSLLEVLQRENGQRKVPGPVLGYGSTRESETVSLKLLTSAKKTE